MRLEPEQKKKLFLWTLGGLLAVLVLIGAVALALSSGGGESPGNNSGGILVPEGELLVNDLYEGQTLIPQFDRKLNQYDPEKFVEKDGFLRYDSSGARLGVDVSEYQGSIDWTAVKDAGMNFAILRLGFRGATQGLLNVDETFEENFQKATDAGLFVGVYFFSQAVTKAEAEAEADFVIQTLNGRKLAYPVVFDWEIPMATQELPAEALRAYDMDGKQVTEFAKAFCDRIKEAGYTPCVYTNKSMAYEFFDLEELKDYDLWYAEYQKAPSLYYDFRIWQYTEEGQVPGIEGGVDIDICFKPY